MRVPPVLIGLSFSVPVLLAGSVGLAAIVVSQEYIYDKAPFPECHASTIAETPQGLVASWFGGQREGDPSVGIWVSRLGETGWSEPVEVANGIQSDDAAVQRFPCWNPVLHQTEGGPLLLFYKVGPNPRAWWGMVMRSSDAGQTWSCARTLAGWHSGPN